MPNVLRKKSKPVPAISSLAQAFQTEAERQKREETVDYARMAALREREEVFRLSPLAWPATMVYEMRSHYPQTVASNEHTSQ